jgi:lipoyl(octanoyl) transferase
MNDQPSQGPAKFLRQDGRAAGWAVSEGLTPYPAALAAMEARADAIAQGSAGELVWLLEHPPLYTAGVSARAEELLTPGALPVFQAGRGGRYTYHGPGQRVAYVMLDLRARRRDVRCFVAGLEAWIIAALARFGVAGAARAGRIGVWVVPPGTGGVSVPEEKIAAVGVKLRRWVSFHGVSVNVAPDLDHFAGIVPCGLADHGVTSLRALGVAADMPALDGALKRAFEPIFGPVKDAPAPLAAR